MADLVTDLKDDDIRTEWTVGEPKALRDDDDESTDTTDGPADDADDDAGDADDDTTDPSGA